MEHDVVSFPYYFQTKASTRQCLVVYHQGHNGHFTLGGNVITRFLDEGCDVIALNMPLLGKNPKTKSLKNHGDFEALRSEQFSPIKFFVEPVRVALNYALEKKKYERVAMIGVSGGGWTTTLTAALDPRIKFSYPVAGSLPLNIRRVKGDWEQWTAELYTTANYYELYLLGVLEPERRSLHFYNLFDPCCFRGHLTAGFATQLEGIARRMGLGKLAFWVDEESRHHAITSRILNFIAADFLLGKGSGLVSPRNLKPF